MNLYIKKIDEIDKDITLKDLLKCIVNEIKNDKHTEMDIDLLDLLLNEDNYTTNHMKEVWV